MSWQCFQAFPCFYVPDADTFVKLKAEIMFGVILLSCDQVITSWTFRPPVFQSKDLNWTARHGHLTDPDTMRFD